MKKGNLFKKGLILGVTACSLFLVQQLKVNAADDASVMPSIENKQILTGFWHNWQANPNDGYKRGSSAEIALRDTPDAYNVVAVAFMKGEGIPTFKPYKGTDAEFRQQVGELNKAGKPVLISLGGADAHVQLKNGDETAFANELIRLVETYGFDGIDIDLEQAAITAGDNKTVIPKALKIVKAHYKAQNQNFIISMAPEFPYLKPGNAYESYLTSLKDEYDFIAPQLYNQGGDGVWVDEISKWVTQNDDAYKYEFLYYMADSLIHGTRGFLQIPASKLAIGLPANNDAGASGYVKDPQVVYNVFDQLKKDGNPIKGLMTWSINWDLGKDVNGVAYNQGFSKAYDTLINGGGGVADTEKPSAPTNVKASNITANQVQLDWTASTDNIGVTGYQILRDGVVVGTAKGTTYSDSGLKPATSYSYQIKATDRAGNVSLGSASLAVKTIEGPEVPSNEWDATKTYVAGDKVTYKGKGYQAQWWTKGEEPGLATSIVWKAI